MPAAFFAVLNKRSFISMQVALLRSLHRRSGGALYTKHKVLDPVMHLR